MIKIDCRIFNHSCEGLYGYIDAGGRMRGVCSNCHGKRAIMYVRQRRWKGELYNSYNTYPCRYCRAVDYTNQVPSQINWRVIRRVGPSYEFQGEKRLSTDGQYIPNTRVRCGR